MISFMIEETKECMQKLLKEEIFDDFLCTQFEMVGLFKVNIDGQIRPEFLSSDEKEMTGDRAFVHWKDLKVSIYDMIKGHRAPTSMKIVFSLNEKAKNATLERINYSSPKDINSFTFTFTYESKKIKVITGTNYANFTMDKNAEQYFDDSMLKFFKKHEIAVMLNSGL